ncbi:MAG: DNA mismatch repair endonuclease MutL [Desulfuromonadaceae bacterium]|nr:DNA mismatch repair endonuclease MutL [Desulfuromonadaceae bacterium]MDD2849728.1 DNA mismatch repair endonuclease MutL [Desulfuromonadaceae bacterium]MDD4130772.1 DNA mismatch repair endonuclease MutL [Desulfuromonadaceae bacterium]
MSQRINILPESLTNKIAAGEVVERPASVIKELIENSLDAGATDISVEINAGGRRRIRVTDNGHGMSREDALLSLERHATSKIGVDSDLDKILTLGFRGEALPSIASVSRFSLATREPASPEGTEIVVEGGRVRDVRACGMASGTVITVEQLFYNLPARLKFMKSAETETGHVADTVSRMAVSRPDIAFFCSCDDRELLRLQRSDLQRRLAQVLGKESSRHLYPVQSETGSVVITGFVSGPLLARSATQSIYTYINGRFIRDKVVQHSIMQAYRGVIDRGRYPVVALFIELPPEEVDVNVHPTKHEVRFRHQSVVHDAIQKAVEETLRRSPWLIDKPAKLDTRDSSVNYASRERDAAAAQASLTLPSRPMNVSPQAELSRMQPTTHVLPENNVIVREPATPFQQGQTPREAGGYFSSLSVIGQFHSEYILCQSGPELVVIDQHAASERVAYQLLRQQCLDGGIESQRLLFPATVELSFSEVAVANRFSKDLSGIGFELEPFGGTTIMISSIPRIVAEKDPLLLVRDILTDLVQFGTSAAFNDVLESLLSRIACHSVIRGCHTLDNRQIKELLYRMDLTDFAASCPHGRPVSHVVTLAELQKIFKRT